MCTSYQLPLNLVFCTNVVQHHPLDLICCKLKAVTLLAKHCKHLMLLRFEAGDKATQYTSEFLFPSP